MLFLSAFTIHLGSYRFLKLEAIIDLGVDTDVWCVQYVFVRACLYTVCVIGATVLGSN